MKLIPLCGLLFVLNLFFILIGSAAYAAPTNDNFAAAMEISGIDGQRAGTNVDATGELGEPDHAGVSINEETGQLNSVWFRWVATSADTMRFTTVGSDFDTTMAVYTGNSVGDLTEIASNDDYNGLQSGVTFTPIVNQTYYIAVDGFSESEGAIALNYYLAPDPVSVSGKIILPTVQSSNVYGWIEIHSENDDSLADDSFVIEAGSSFVSWTLDVAIDRAERVVVVAYLDMDSAPGPEYLEIFYYNNAGSTAVWDNAQLISMVSLGDQSYDLTLVKGDMVEGTISLQAGESFVSGGSVTVRAAWGSGSWWEYVSRKYDLNPGETFVDYSLAVPKDAPGYWLEYFQVGAPAGYLADGFYNADQHGFCRGTATLFTAGNGYSNIDFNFLKNGPAAGDVNYDGNVDLKDAIIGLQVMSGMSIAGTTICADVNGDEKINLPEVIHVLKAVKNSSEW